MTISHIEPDADTQARYDQEREKRLRSDAAAQFINLNASADYSYLDQDCWVDHAALNRQEPPIRDGEKYEFLILGAGYGGLIFAVRLIQSGVPAKNIRLVDSAGGFGGTWYWNRYPGLMCDVESYIYMPLLEETGYMPKHKYSYGPELRAHADRIAAHFDLTDKALFRSRIVDQTWDETSKNWIVNISEYRGPQLGFRSLRVTSRFTILTGGVLNVPHIPNIPGIDSLEIPHFHSARWDYGLTGGSPENQQLERLKDKRVGIIGTGPTAIQVIPELAKWSQQLIVFQRTPASCDTRGQRETDPKEWSHISAEKGWQKKRAENFNYFVRAEPVETDLVHDGWCEMPSFSALLGSTRKGIVHHDDSESHIAELNALDFPRAQRLRARVDDIVKDEKTAEKLKSWYPTYCKRPTFHDEYLQSFNKPNVELVSTSGYGIERVTERGVVVDGIEYPIDVLIFSTGFRTTVLSLSTPAQSCDMKVIGRNGLDLDDKWAREGPTTLHGCCSHGFPNLFFASSVQCGAACNLAYVLDNTATQVAYYISAARKIARSKDFTVEPSEEAEESWANESASMSSWFAAIPACTPGYFNGYGDTIDASMHAKLARAAPWGAGSQDFVDRVQQWREAGNLSGLNISG